MNFKKIPLIIIIFILCTTLVGCNVVDNVTTKLGIRNKDFEYIKQNNVEKIVIQSTRDSGFRFIVSDKTNIRDIYDILSSAKATDKKTELQPDYIFEIHMGSEIKKFNYVAGFKDGKQGNFYDENKSYIMSKRLDNDIIQYLSFIRKPREFQNVYYPSILKVLESNTDMLNIKDGKVGIDILGDIECTKYMLSVDIDDFIRKARDIVPNCKIINHDRENFDIIVSVNNYGYKTKTFKSIITIDNKKENSQKRFYADCTYDNGWTVDIQESMPKEWK